MWQHPQSYNQPAPSFFPPGAPQHAEYLTSSYYSHEHQYAAPTYGGYVTYAHFSDGAASLLPSTPGSFNNPGLTPEQQNWLILVEQRKKDKEFLNTFVLMKKGKVSSSKTTITDYKMLYDEARKLLEELKVKKLELEQSKEVLTDEQWASAVDRILLIKESLTKLSRKLEEDSGTFHRLVEKQRKKRAWLKRKNDRSQENEDQEMERRKEIESAIDEWRNKQIEEELKQKRDKETKREADLVLSEVLRKKNEAKQCIKLLETLNQLREARAKTMQNTYGFHPDSKADEQFSKISGNLKRLMENQLKNYDGEETTLRNMLDIQ